MSAPQSEVAKMAERRLSDRAELVREWRKNRTQLLNDGVRQARSRDFIRMFLWTALPITAQALMTSSRTVFDVFMTSSLGAPALGVTGAAYTSALSFAIEAVVVAVCAVWFYDRDLFSPRRITEYLDGYTVWKTLRIGLPISRGSVVWAIGIFAYSIISAMAGTAPLAVLALVTPVESTAIAVLIGLSSTTNVIVGQALGRADFRRATVDAIALVLWTIIASLLMSLLLLALKPALLVLYDGAGGDVMKVADNVFTVLAAVLIFRSLNVTMVVGILRAGGDTKSPVVTDLAAQWLVAIPLSFACVVFFALPFPWGFLAFNSEEMARQVMALFRFRQFAWLNQIRPDG